MDQQEQPAAPVKKSLFNIRQDHLSLLALIEENDGVLDDEMQAALQLSEEDFKEKAISYGFLIRKLDAESDTIAAEIKRLQGLKQRADNRAELFRKTLDEGMKQFGYDKIDSELLKISYRKSNPVELSETFLDDILQFTTVSMKIVEGMEDKAADAGINEDILQLLDLKPSASKTRVGDALKQGVKVPGASIVEKKNLQIR
ncbi:siphovirus Gp157 family protein [Chitinophaga sp.]|uniref:siphovirus Gp157 family protein n=1 Tax=Chitinophaga sp. TaxID=1869181 RepID=UPI0031D86D07